MARTALTPITAPGSYGGTWTEITWTAADASNFNSFSLTGRELLLIYNSSADTGYDVTLTSVDDRYGRSENVGPTEVAFGDYMMFGPIALEGWQQTDGSFYLTAENAAIKFAVIRLP